ncbi:hypothetical protein [uncultured Alteromonas sp.]|jgi:hypothetical protein|nr:hypothetical protein [uncultured Alteromonas sp.]
MLMPLEKWLRQYAIAFPVLTGIFTLSQYVNDLPEKNNENKSR